MNKFTSLGTKGNERHKEATRTLAALEKDGRLNKSCAQSAIIKEAKAFFSKSVVLAVKRLMPGEILLVRTSFEIMSEDRKHLRTVSDKRPATPEYRKWRQAVFARDRWTCTECGSKKEICAHHKQPFSRFPELRHEVSNGQTLCADCHAQKHPHLKIIKR